MILKIMDNFYNYCCGRSPKKKILNKEKKYKFALNNECSFVLCSNINKREFMKKAKIKDRLYFFCSDDCWIEWLSQPYII